MNALTSKMKEVLYSVLPITVIVLLLHFTLTPLEFPMVARFIVGAIIIVLGLAIFLLGVDIGITPIGNYMGSSVAKSNKLWVVLVCGVFLGFFISVAEPDLQILAKEVASVTGGQLTSTTILVVVSLGIAVMLAIGLARIIFNVPLYKVLTIVYVAIGIIALFVTPEFLAISFDASGATTGAMTVPFVLALAMGVSVLKKDSKASEKDSFGLVAIASTGAILAVMLMSVLKKSGAIAGEIAAEKAASSAIIRPFLEKIPHTALEVFVALIPVVLLFLLFRRFSFKMAKRALRRIMVGVLFTFIGLVLFLVGVNAGFMDVGREIGQQLAALDNKAFVIIIGFVLGFVTILAEPAVHVLTQQIEEVTSGYVRRIVVMGTLSIGVGLAVMFSMLRILIPNMELWHFLLPGYALSLGLMYIVPKLFVGIAFDSGGVASGPMTATFILAFAQGVAEATEGADVLTDGFGMIAMVAMMPLIVLQILGFIFKMKSKKGGLTQDGHGHESI